MMKGSIRFMIGALCALLLTGAIAQPPGAAGLVWLDNQVEFKLNSANLVTTGAISTTLSIPAQSPVILSKPANSLNIQLNLSALIGWPGLPTITLTGTVVDPAGSIINWATGPVDINVCLRRQDIPDLPADVLIKRINGANLRVQATILSTPYHSTLANRDFWVQMVPTDGNTYNYVQVEAYAFCVESSFTRIDGTIRDANYIAYSGPIPEPASLFALGSGLIGLLGLRRRKR